MGSGRQWRTTWRTRNVAKARKEEEGSAGSVGMDRKPGVRFRKTERKTMRMEQLSIKSGNEVGEEKRVFEINETKGEMGRDLTRFAEMPAQNEEEPVWVKSVHER